MVEAKTTTNKTDYANQLLKSDSKNITIIRLEVNNRFIAVITYTNFNHCLMATCLNQPPNMVTKTLNQRHPKQGQHPCSCKYKPIESTDETTGKYDSVEKSC